MMKEVDMDQKIKQDFDLLIKTSMEIGNKLAGQKIPEGINYIHYAEGLGQKTINHILTARYLMDGYHLGLGNNLYEGKIDFSSIAILTRAALETYLTFNHIFIAPENEDEKRFRYTLWDIGGYLDRQDFEPTNDEFIALKESERLAIERLRKELKEKNIFKELSPKNQKQALNGQWKLDKYWGDLAVGACFKKEFFRQQYKFLCGYAHSSRLSIIQIQQNKTIEGQREMAKASMGVLMVVLAKYIYDYIHLLPQLEEVKNNIEKYPIIKVWKAIGEEI